MWTFLGVTGMKQGSHGVIIIMMIILMLTLEHVACSVHKNISVPMMAAKIPPSFKEEPLPSWREKGVNHFYQQCRCLNFCIPSHGGAIALASTALESVLLLPALRAPGCIRGDPEAISTRPCVSIPSHLFVTLTRCR